MRRLTASPGRGSGKKKSTSRIGARTPGAGSSRVSTKQAAQAKKARARKSPPAASAPTFGLGLLGNGRGTRPGVTATAQSIKALAISLSDCRAALGCDQLSAEQTAELQKDTEPDAADTAALLADALPDEPEIATVVGVSADQMNLLVAQRGEMVEMLDTAIDLQQGVTDSRSLLQSVAYGEIQTLARQINAMLQDNRLSPEFRKQLKSDSSDFLGRLATAQAQVQQAAQETIKTQRDQATQLAATQRRNSMLETMVDVKHGVAVDAQAVDEAAATYDELYPESGAVASAGGTGAEISGTAVAPTVNRRGKMRG